MVYDVSWTDPALLPGAVLTGTNVTVNAVTQMVEVNTDNALHYLDVFVWIKARTSYIAEEWNMVKVKIDLDCDKLRTVVPQLAAVGAPYTWLIDSLSAGAVPLQPIG